MGGMSKEWKPPEEDAEVFAQYKAHVEGERKLKPEMEEAADRALASGATVGQLARHTGLTPEVFRRRARKLGIEHKRAPTVGKLRDEPEPPAPPRESRRASAPQPLTPTRKPDPEPSMEGRMLLEDEAKHFADLARSRATALQIQAFDQATATASDRLKDYVIVSTAMGMELLAHDEVYATAEPERPAGSEETSG
jgi:transposase-like protein